MSRFADPHATKEVDLGACQCPGTPHLHDVAMVRTELGAAGRGRIAAAYGSSEVGKGDASQLALQALRECLVSWNLIGPDGRPAPINVETIDDLDGETVGLLFVPISALLNDRATLPNGSGAISAPSLPVVPPSIPAIPPTTSSTIS